MHGVFLLNTHTGKALPLVKVVNLKVLAALQHFLKGSSDAQPEPMNLPRVCEVSAL